MISKNRHLFLFCLAALCSVSLVSCVVDKSYDFDPDNIDWTINVLKGAKFPIMSSEKFVLGDIVSNYTKGLIDETEEGYVINVPSGVNVKGREFGMIPVKGISTLDLDDIRIKTAELHVELSNNLPVALGISAEAVDTEGKHVDGVLVECSGNIAKGPSSTNLVITVTPADGIIAFDGFRLNLTIDEFPSNGTVILKDAGMRLLSSYLYFPEGVTHIDK